MTNPLIFMVSVAGKPTENRICKYLNFLKNSGIKQVMIYPRSGCELKYMSDEWFSAVGFFIKHAKILGMKIWLYDDFNWPSGDAAGEVTKNPDYRLRFIKVSGNGRGKLVSSADEGDKLYFGENHFTNLMCDEAVECFIKSTHERYYEKFSEYFGNVIVGIFTDEPAIGYSCPDDSLPYYDGFADDYKNDCGRDFYEDIKTEHPEFTVAAMRVIAKRFKKCYIDRLSDWCKSRGIIMTGHLMNDNTPFKSVKSSGDLLKCLSGFMLPGIDEIFTNLKSGWLQTLLGAAEYASGDFGAMAELFALGPCELSYTTKLCMMYLAACFKIDHYFLAISHIDFRGNMKITDFFNHFGIDQPDFEGMKLLAQNAELAAQYAKKDFKTDVYIRYPVKTCAKKIISGIEDYPLALITNRLSYYQLQWKFITEDENPEDAPIIEFEDDFKYRLGNTVTDNADLICKMFNIETTVLTQNGEIPDGLFVRKYPDGDFIVVNHSGKAGIYLINGEAYELCENGVITGAHFENYRVSQGENLSDVKFKIKYPHQNITRTMHFDSSVARIVCDIQREVIVAIRNGESIVVNGREICGSEKTALSFGFEDIYRDSKVCLNKGENIIKANNDFCFMPTVFLIGDFSAQYDAENNTLFLNERKAELSVGEHFECYGAAEFSAEITLPENTCSIELEGTRLFTKIYINDTLIGEKITAPYKFDVKQFAGKTVELKIMQYSSMVSMFSQTDIFPRKGSLSTKRIRDNSLLFGFDEILYS